MNDAIEKLRKQLQEKSIYFAEKANPPRMSVAGNNGPIGMDVAMMLFEAIESQAKEIEQLKANTVLSVVCKRCNGTGQQPAEHRLGAVQLPSTCDTCGGNGSVLTEYGLKIKSVLKGGRMGTM